MPDWRPCSAMQKKYSKIFSFPRDPDHEYIYKGSTYREVYSMASGIIESLSHGKSRQKNEIICLCTDNRALIAAALIASFYKDICFALPYSFDADVIKEMNNSLKFSKIIIDQPVEAPQGMEILIPGKSDNRLKQLRDPDSLCLKLFTGGSTGKPRVWSKTIRNLISESIYLSGKFNVAEGDLIVATVPPRHIYGLLFSVLLPYVSNAGVLPGISTFPGEIASAIQNNPVTVFVSVPMHYKVLKDIPAGSLRLAFSSAGVLNKTDGERFYADTGIPVVEIYGSTETGGIATRSTGEECFTPFSGINWDIADGRIRVKSDFLSPELPRDSNGFFTTGDRADYYQRHGFILQGRADGIVKVGGKRVDLDEIREKIKNITGVKDAFVISMPVREGRENEIAAVVETEIELSRLKKLINDIPGLSIAPRRIRIADKIPYISTGKIDREKIETMFART